MGCYTAPLAAAIVHYGLRKNVDEWKNSRKHKQLNLLLVGGSIFGVVDHLINGELLAFSMRDMLLGLTITAAIVAFWVAIVVTDKSSESTKTIA